MKEIVAKTPKRYVIFILLYVGWIFDFLDRMVMSIAVIPIAEDFQFNTTETGLIMSSFFVGFAVMQIPGGILTDKFGSRRVIITSILVWSIFTIFTGLAWGLISLLFIRLIFGVGEAGFPAASQKGIADFYPKEQRGKASSAMMSSNVLGGALAPMIGAPLLVMLGWRHTFLALGLAGFLLVLVFTHYFKPPKEIENRKARQSNKVPMKTLFKDPHIWKLLLMWFGAGCVNWGLSMWSPTYLIEVRGLNMVSFGFVVAIPALAGAIATIIAGWLVENIFKNREKYFAAVSMVLLGGSLYMFFSSATITGVIIFMSLSTMFISGMLATVFSLPHKWLPEKVIGTAMGTINMGGQAAGIVAPSVMGLLITAAGFDKAFWFLIGAALFSGIVALTINKREALANDDEIVIDSAN